MYVFNKEYTQVKHWVPQALKPLSFVVVLLNIAWTKKNIYKICPWHKEKQYTDYLGNHNPA